MPNDSILQRQCAAELTKAIVNLFGPLLRPEEVQDAIVEVYEAVAAGMRDYEVRRNEVYKRLKPLSN